MADPWAEFRSKGDRSQDDPWKEFRAVPGAAVVNGTPFDQFQTGQPGESPAETIANRYSTFAKPDAGKAPAARPAQANMGVTESFGRGIAEGGTFGFDDKLGMDRERRDLSKKANPWTHFAGEIVGGAASMAVPSMAAARIAQVGGRVAGATRAALSPLASAPVSTVPQAAMQGAKLGITYGGLSGAGHAEDGEAVHGALTGAALGGITGVALGPVAYKIGEKIGIAREAKRESADASTSALTAIDRSLARDVHGRRL